MVVATAFHPGEAVARVSVVQEAGNDLPHIGPLKTVVPGEMTFIGLDKGLEIVFNTAAIIG